MENLLPVCTGKKLSVVCIKILPVLFCLNTSLVYKHAFPHVLLYTFRFYKLSHGT